MKYFIVALLMISSCGPKIVELNKDEINKFLDDWHMAAATAQEDAYFNAMAEDGVYIGTDKTERWYRDELREWAQKAFQRDVAWDFKAYDRKIYSSDDHQIVWFNELLNTKNLGICRGSGVLQKINGKWKIKHYHLSMTIDNADVDDYLDMIKNKKEQAKEAESGHKE